MSSLDRYRELAILELARRFTGSQLGFGWIFLEERQRRHITCMVEFRRQSNLLEMIPPCFVLLVSTICSMHSHLANLILTHMDMQDLGRDLKDGNLTILAKGIL